ncbi:MAG TPA: universal stress protein [Methylomirabilota bacterium]|nr:universal stress protein [Methylomirabilota bacterium]
MKRFEKILVPTDLSEYSRQGLRYACSLAADEKAALVVLHIANEFEAWELFSDDFGFCTPTSQAWPTDRVLAEASLDLSRFLEKHLDLIKSIPSVTKRVVLGAVAQQITTVAEEEKADMIVMSPRRHRTLRHFLGGSITDRVMRMSPCPVLSVSSPLPSQLWRRKHAPIFFGWPRQKVATQS